MRRRLIFISVCLATLLLIASIPGRYWPVATTSLASQSAARCKTVVKKVHGHHKKVKVCKKKKPTPTPVPPLFIGPSEIAFDSAGNALIAVQGQERILTLSPSGAVLASWTNAGTNPSVFQQLYGLALDEQGNVYVSDPADHVIDKLSPSGQPVAQWSTEVAETGSFPTLLAVTPSGEVYVSDHTSETVLHFSTDGKLLGQIGKGILGDPYGVTLGPDGNLYISDFQDDRVREFTPDGKQLSQWGDGANGTVKLDRPEAIELDHLGNIYVTGQGGQFVEFDRTGHVLLDLAAASGLTLDDPSGLAFDSSGNIFVVEYLGARVDKLSPSGQVLAVWK